MCAAANTDADQDWVGAENRIVAALQVFGSATLLVLELAAALQNILRLAAGLHVSPHSFHPVANLQTLLPSVRQLSLVGSGDSVCRGSKLHQKVECSVARLSRAPA